MGFDGGFVDLLGDDVGVRGRSSLDEMIQARRHCKKNVKDSRTGVDGGDGSCVVSCVVVHGSTVQYSIVARA